MVFIYIWYLYITNRTGGVPTVADTAWNISSFDFPSKTH